MAPAPAKTFAIGDRARWDVAKCRENDYATDESPDSGIKEQLMSIVIAGLGVAVPEHFIEQADAAQRAHTLVTTSAKEQQMTAVLYRRSGVKTRHSVLLRVDQRRTGPARFFSAGDSNCGEWPEHRDADAGVRGDGA